MIFPSEQDFALLLFQLFALLSLGLALGEWFRRLRQPTVIGEILAGVLLGPSVLGVLAPGVSSALFSGPQTQLLGSLAWLGSVFLLLVAGLEINLAILIQQRRVVALSSLVGIAVPFTFGFLLGINLPHDYLIDPTQRPLFSLFLATALSISAIPIIAKILMDLGLLRTGVGQAILGAAIVNDLVGWVFFAVILSMLSTTAHGQRSVTATVVLTITFAMACLTLGRKLVTILFAYFKDLKLPAEGILGVAVLVAFLCAAFTQWIGIHAIFGAFLAGVMIGETGEATNGPRELLRQMVFYIFAPIFFASMGLRANFVNHFDLPLVSAMLAVALAAKFTGGYLGAYLGGKRGHQACAIGFGLMPQGAMGIILAFLALEFSLINETVFVALVSTALVTSVLSGPLIKWAMAPSHLSRNS
ncbi:MAG TPA: cation:proton antiporter [Candidatus Binatia bacterium]|nr:cation:proton antiporter [Candidatus Binatia bacterium]